MLMDDIGMAIGFIYLVDNYDGFLSKFQCFLQYKTCLRHGTLKSVYQEQNAIGHIEDAFNFASKVRVTGRKAENKEYFRHTGYMGHARFTPLGTMLQKHPERVIEKAVYGMLPKTALGRQVLRRKLRVYANADHPHVAQQPTPLSFSHLSEK